MASKQSPAWKNPRELMRRHLKSRSSRRTLLERGDSNPCTESQPPFTSAVLTGNSCNNPFKKSRKRAGGDKENCPLPVLDDEEHARHGFFALSNDDAASLPPAALCSADLSVVYPVDFSSLFASTPKTAAVCPSSSSSSSARSSTSAPVDLRPGTELRVTASKSFVWMDAVVTGRPGNVQVRVTGADSSTGIAIFVQNTDRQMASVQARLEAATLYWQFPNLAWMPSFPRIDDRSRLLSSRDAAFPSIATLGEKFVSALNLQWQESFEQLFYSWKSGECESFYVCCYNTTVAFVKVRSGNGEMVSKAVVTPTTVGVRQIFRQEEIDFTIPLRSSSSRRSSRESAGSGTSSHSLPHCSSLSDVTQSQPPLLADSSPDLPSADRLDGATDPPIVSSDSDTSPNKLNSSNELENATWLQETIGISPLSTLKLRRYSSVSERSTGSAGSADDTSKSAVVVTEGASIQALFNLLLTSKFCRASTGPQAGLPPTLLSERPFHNAALKALKKSSRVSTVRGGGSKDLQFVFEAGDGAVMPWNVRRIAEVLSREGGKVTVSVGGRASCPGLNAAVDADQFSDVVEFSVENGEYCWRDC